ncbi:MAG: VanZ family protein [Nanoarchaeota archaeon]|nr:VanZ family protein [Nanoarchaeota archaeon]
MIRWFEKHNKFSCGVTILIGAVIFYLSSKTFEPGTAGTNLISMIYHICAFFFFAFFLSISLVGGKKKLFLVLAFALSVIYGISDEFHQFFVPGRCTSLFDVFLDSVGIVFAIMVYLIFIEARE